MKTMTVNEFQAACKLQANTGLETVVKCPVCGCLQMGQDFVDAGLSADKAMRQLGFNCIGRHTGAPAARKSPDGKPCNWTLGGLFQLHTMEVVTPDGKTHPHFELATNEEAEAYRASRGVVHG